MNKWKEVADLFGLDLNEEFKVEGNDATYKFVKDGLVAIGTDFWHSKEWIKISYFLPYLVDETYKIIKKPWKPNDGEHYWVLVYSEPSWRKWEGDYEDLTFWRVGNCFKTKEEAEIKGTELMTQIKQEYKEA